jgi:Arc/MetJ-type ribon-helix-helix transcriptional regulator
VNTPTITIRLEPELIKILDQLVMEGKFKSKSHILRKSLLYYLKMLNINVNEECLGISLDVP